MQWYIYIHALVFGLPSKFLCYSRDLKRCEFYTLFTLVTLIFLMRIVLFGNRCYKELGNITRMTLGENSSAVECRFVGPKVESSNIFFYSFYGLGIKASRFQLKDRNSILLTSKVEGLFYLFALSIVIFGVMVIYSYRL